MRDRILIVHPGALGDFLLSVPAIRLLKEKGNSEVYVCLREPGKSLASLFPFIDGAFDLDLVLPERLPFRFSRVYLIGESWGDDQVEAYRRVSKDVLVGPPVKKALKWKVLEYVEALCGNCSIPQSVEVSLRVKRRRIVSIHPGSGSPLKNWPLKGFVNLGEFFRKKGFGVVFVLGPSEEEMVSQVPSHFEVFYKRSILEVSELLSSSMLYLGNDSGISHLSSILGTPSVVVFRASDPCIWRPYGKRVYIVDVRR